MLFSKMNSETFRSFAYASLFKPAGFELCNITSLPQCMGESSKEGADEDFVILCGNRSDELTTFFSFNAISGIFSNNIYVSPIGYT